MNSIYVQLNMDSYSFELLGDKGLYPQTMLSELSYERLISAIEGSLPLSLKNKVYNPLILTQINQVMVIKLKPQQTLGFSGDFTIQQTLDLLNHANRQFSNCASIDELCYQAVYIAKNKLLVDRASILLVGDSGNELLGSWATNEQGVIVDDRDVRLDTEKLTWLDEAIEHQSEVYILEDTDLYRQDKKVGRGWKTIITIWHGGKPAGWFICDNLIHGVRLGQNDRILITLFGLVLSQWFVQIKIKAQFNSLNEILEQQVQAKTVELQKTVDRLAKTREDLVNTEKSKALSNFTAGIAHEINNPIGFIKSNLSFIGKVSSQVLAALVKHASDELADSRERLEEIDEVIDESVEGLDRVSAIISMLQPLNNLSVEVPQDFDLLQSIEFFIMGLDIDPSLIKIIQPKQQITVHLPLQAFTLALDSIVSNALDAVDEIDNPEISIEALIDEDYLMILIVDNGIGISAANVNSIFDPFFTTKAVGKGMGLGLSVSYNLLKMANGEIMAESTEGKGTTMTIRFEKEVVIND